MRLLICVPILLAGCGAGGEHVLLRTVGTIENPELDEVSGLAQSRRYEELLWVVNDDGPASLHAVSQRGENLGQVTVAGATNEDWEDLAAFAYQDKNYLVVADIGDNDARRPSVTLYVVEEPEPAQTEVALAWRVDFRYPEGPRDAESLAVDADGELFYILSKRDVPARLFTVPIRPAGNATVLASQVAVLDSLPQPSQRQRNDAEKSGFSWQPTAMDFAANAQNALVLTYGGVYFFARDAGQSWHDALRSTALEFKLGQLSNAEAITLSQDSMAAHLTVEKQHAPLLRIDLAEAHMWHKNHNMGLR
ncbi:MAG: hypothetical protein OEW64_14755 [Gammaproteobacteria bacterium]|nr:hypothetical protein [Gammaproteobacteria bacterium]MDH5305345.1 hypothetical protein [Gammaproteobacteria bacterium]MDH5323733.1 hypothetical protein [Gammaproteobacteria bacterium]